MTLKIDNEFKNLIPPLTAEEYAGLEESILRDGCRDALVVWNNTLVDGHNRYEICQKHDIPFKTIEKDFNNRNDVIVWIIQNQLARRNLPAYERARLALRLKPAVAERAKEKSLQNLRQGTKSPDRPKLGARGDTEDILARAAGISHGTLAKVEKLEELAPEPVKEQLRQGTVSIDQAYKNLRFSQREKARAKQREENVAKVEKLATPLEAQGLFQTIVIDPPWDYGDAHMFGRGWPDYATMPLKDIADLPIEKIADENCHLYLWVTNKFLHEGFHLIEKWGFKFITCLTWIKPSIGMGNYFRTDTEQVLFAVKGGQLTKRSDIGTHFEAPRGKGHSAKPDEFYSLVESCSYAPYIDIFGRKGRAGWSVWGENG